MKIKHSVIIITYNQEMYISTCIESILQQSVIPYELIISDDCSTDNTWDIIMEYQKRFPQIIKIYRNEQNIGINPHLNKIKQYPTGDIVNVVAGDDMLPEGILYKYSEFIKKNNLFVNIPFMIYTNSFLLSPDGTIREVSNYINRKHTPLDLTCFHAMYIWETGMSIELFKKTADIRTDIGYQADWLYHIDRTLECERYFYIDEPGYIYRENVGVTVSSHITALAESRYKVCRILMNDYWNNLSFFPKWYVCFELYKSDYFVCQSIISYIKMLCLSPIILILPKNAPMRYSFRNLAPIFIRKIYKYFKLHF